MTRLAALDRLRTTLGYEATLTRGFAVVRAEGAVVTEAGAASAADRLEIQFKDGRVGVSVSGEAPNPAPKPAKKSAKTKPSDDQGSLF